MRKILVAAVAATAITLGTQEAALAPPDSTAPVQQTVITITVPLDGRNDLSYQPEMSPDD